MKQHFQDEEKTRSYTTPAPVAASETVAEVTVPTATTTQKTPRTLQPLRTRQRGFTRLRPLSLSKRGALWLLSGALLFGGRWYWANLTPTIPNVASKLPKQVGVNAQSFYAAAVETIPGREFRQIEGPETASVAEQKETVAKLAPALAILRQGLPYHYQGNQTTYFKGGSPYQTGLSAPVPDFMAIRSLARGLLCEARLKEQAGDFIGAQNAALDAAKLGAEFGNGAESLIQPMVGEAILSMSMKEASRTASKLTPTQAAVAQARLQEISTRRVPLAAMWEGELRQNVDLLRTLFENPKILESFMSSANQDNVYSLYFSNLLVYGKQGLVDQVSSYENQVLERFKLPYQKARQQFPVLPESEVAQLLLANTGRLMRGYATRSAELALWQAALQNRATGSLKSVPADAFSASGQEPLRVSASRDKAWSVGPNGVDESGGGDDLVQALK